jgi:hypothetical protein
MCSCLDDAANASKDLKEKWIKPCHLQLATGGDEEFFRSTV